MRPTYVVATDLSADSRKAARIAAALSRRTRAQLDAFCALPRSVVQRYRIAPAHVRELLAAISARGEDERESAAHVVTVAKVADVPAAIVRRAQDAHASLVVVAPHGATGWRRVLLGSVARRVLALAKTSVLVARAPTAAARGPFLAGVDLGPTSELVLRHAVALARALERDLEVVHVVSPVDLLLPTSRATVAAPTLVTGPARQLARLVEVLPHRGVRIATRAVVGSPARHLVEDARRLRAPVVVLGATSKSRPRRALLGSVAHAVAGTCAVSVLVVRPGPSTALPW
jgi:nucleotide-binding universal stress UspA family protein